MLRGIFVCLLVVLASAAWAQPRPPGAVPPPPGGSQAAPSAQGAKPAKPAAPRKQAKPRRAKDVPAAPQSQSAGKTICVASGLGRTFDVKTIGLMVFGNALERVAIESWGIDDAVVRQVGAVVGKQYAVQRIKVPQAALAAYEKPALFSSPINDLFAAVRAATPPPAKCELYVLVNTTSSSYPGTNQTLDGLGILHHDTLFERHYLYAIYSIYVFDGATSTRLRGETAATDPILMSAISGPGIHGMYRRLDKSWWPATPQAAAQNAQLKNATRMLVEEGLAKTVPGMLSSSSAAARGADTPPVNRH
jgi:hypothetical protein